MYKEVISLAKCLVAGRQEGRRQCVGRITKETKDWYQVRNGTFSGHGQRRIRRRCHSNR